MSKTMIESNLFNDSWFFSLSNEAKLLFLFLIANHNCNLIGCYEFPLALIMPHLKTTEQKLLSLFDELKDKVIYQNGWVIIRNYEKHNPMRNPNIELAKTRQLNALPDEIKNTLETLTKGLPNPLQSVGKRSKVMVKEKEKEKVIQIEEKKFSTLESINNMDVFQDIASYFKTSVTNVQNSFVDLELYHYSSGKTYKNYKAALSNFVKRKLEGGNHARLSRA